ncbi:hypothetical protein M422DRAFT_268024 [Sphaerobolus stellatus SS14]|uniref:Uncharacterized protein n=1 Tax=Sphaerobolus stellatus (strain SS14) TaxID=990650 RepID=A0A0C9TL09_SPHS4|nr:hypothetical protein M422DRAFT_268024 [Sphaerobolus stellatus SS14]
MPSTTLAYESSRTVLKHVNLMTDTFIANASAQELRAVIRSLLSTMPAAHGTFSCIARSHLKQSAPCRTLPPPASLFTLRGATFLPTQQFMEMLSHARMLFGVGLGVESLTTLTYLIRATYPLRWSSSDNDPLLPHLAVLDSDVAQAVQSCKEELVSGYLKSEEEIAVAKRSLEDIYNALEESRTRVASWDGEFCFDRAYFAVEYLRRTFK